MRPSAPARTGGRRRAALVLLAATALLAGCALTPRFPDTGAGPYRPKPDLGSEAGPQPETPGDPRQPGPGGPGGEPLGAPKGCVDPDPHVVATCLEPVSSIIVLDPEAKVGLATERTTGRVQRVQQDRPNQQVAALDVDPTGDGGLTGLALSPHYAEDELMYAYITTPIDNRVVRLAPQDVPKPVLTGIPRGATGNAGALQLDSDGMLVVATGDAGDPAAADDPNSLAGKLLRIDPSGRPAAGNPSGSKVLAGGLHSPGGLCTDPFSGELWVTDRAADRDALYRVTPGHPIGSPAWSWPNRPGAAGCVVMQGRIQVAFTSGAPMFALGIGPEGTFVGKPLEIPLEHYGRVAAAALSPDGRSMWLGTVNKTGGKPISSDERVFILTDPVGSAGGQD
ncbi:MAG TPA: PQQ-dependent sugar dehydrogenase [Pseudonocardiaceae bacterium]